MYNVHTYVHTISFFLNTSVNVRCFYHNSKIAQSIEQQTFCLLSSLLLLKNQHNFGTTTGSEIFWILLKNRYTIVCTEGSISIFKFDDFWNNLGVLLQWALFLFSSTVFPRIVSSLELFPLNSFNGNYSIYEVKKCHNVETIWKFPHFPLSKKNSFHKNYSRKYGIMILD